jgi:hypothetical protein
MMQRSELLGGYGAMDLRCDMVRGALDARRKAALVRRAALLAIATLLALQITGDLWQLPWSAWVAQHRALVSFVNITLTLLTAAHQWCVERRLEESEDALLALSIGLGAASRADTHP